MKHRSMKLIKIKQATLHSICVAAGNTFPKEFIALLGSSRRDGVIDELVVLPSTFGENFSSIRLDLLPFDKSIVGSVHSHPTTSSAPSSADLRVFKKTGETHLIIAYPFSSATIRGFDSDGKELSLEAVE
jgi:proteasome lid subunit RPN8/RPN11